MSDKRKKWEEAIRWFLWMRQHKANAEEIDVFKRWQKQDPDHQGAFEEIESVWALCDSMDDLPWPCADELAGDTYDGRQPIALPDLPTSTLLSTTSHQLFGSSKESAYVKTRNKLLSPRIYAAAASLLLFVSAGWVGLTTYQSNSTDFYETAVASKEVFKLEDGSVITMGALSKLSVKYTGHRRYIKLMRGEAYFEVAKESARPFIVDTGRASVEAVGTAFNINKRAGSTVVSVIEGIVKFERASVDQEASDSSQAIKKTLSKGQQVVYEKQSGQVQLTDNKELVRANSWRSGNLAYVSEHLDKVIEDVNRYSKTKLVIGDKEIGNLIFTGTILNYDIKDWLDGLVKTFPIRMIEVEEKIILLSPLKTS